MKQEKASNKALKHIVCCFILIIIFVITITRVNAQTKDNLIVTGDVEDIVPLRPQLNESLLELERIKIGENKIKLYDNPRVVEKNIEYYININEKPIKFFAEAFGYDMDFIKEDLKNRNDSIEEIEPTNIASLKTKKGNINTYPNTEYGIVEYFYELTKTNKKERTKKIKPYTGSSEYVEKLIKYYTGIYTNVDSSVALSIGAAESGYYKVKYMLKKNNVYGGMSNKGLIRHDNIELGVLSYIKMLSKNYYGKGLDTVSKIGRIYCPTINEYGNKIASPHWINLVNTARKKYNNYTQDIKIEDIVNY